MINSLIIGANGLVGQNIYNLLKSKNENVIGSCFSRSDSNFETLNILDTTQVANIFLKYTPQKVFFCANFSGGVNRCELEQDKATEFHLDAVKYIINQCKKYKSKLIFISTDYVFADSNSAVAEDHQRSPLNYYGELKKHAEDYIIDNLKNYLIARTTNIYGLDLKTKTPNYFMQALLSLKENKQFKASSEMFGTPTPVTGLVSAIIELCTTQQSGIFHIVGPEYVNRYDWAIEIAQIFSLNKSLIKNTQANKGICKRPLNLRLATDKLNDSIEYKICGLNKELKNIKSIYEAEEDV